MTKMSLFLVFIVAAATVSTVLGECDYSACRAPTGSGSDYCRLARTYLDCMDKNIVNNNDCDSIVKNSLKSVIDQAKTNLDNADCDGAASLVTSLVLTLGFSSLVYFLTSSQ